MNFQRTPLAAAIFAAIVSPVAVSQFAHAEQAESEITLAPVKVQDSGIKNDYVPGVSTVGAKTATPIRDIPQTVNVINRAVLDAQGVTSLKDALRNVPGITISAGEGGTIGDNINLRGFSSRTDVYIDGFRDRGQYTRDTFYLEAVEVLKGPSSMLFGRGSTGGVINQSSKKPDLKEHGEVSASLGTDDYYRTTLDVNQPIADDAAIRVAAFGQDVRSSRDVVHNKDFGVAPSLRFGIGTPTEVTISGLVQRNKDIPDYGFPLVRSDRTINSVSKPVDAPKDRFYGYTDDHFDQDVNVLNLTIKHDFNSYVSFTNRTQYNEVGINASPSPFGALSVIGAATGSAAAIPTEDTPLNQISGIRQDKDRSINDTSLFNQTDLVAKLNTGAIQHTVTAGMEVGTDHYRNDYKAWTTTNAQRAINLGDPVLGTRQGQRLKASLTDVTGDTFAVYANDQIDLNKQWKLVGGLRWDRFRADADQTTYVTAVTAATPIIGAIDTTLTSGVPKTFSVSQNTKMVSTRAGVIWQPDETQSYYVSYGTSFNPSSETVTISYTQANVEPEKNRSYELGSKLDFLAGNLQLNSALFQIEKTNARTTDSTGLVTLDGDIRVRGFEVSAVGRVTPAWQILAGYTRLDGKVIDSNDFSNVLVQSGTGTITQTLHAKGNTLQNTPKDTATLWTTYTLFDDWELGGGAVYSSKRFVNNFESAQIDGYTRFDATLAYRQPKYDVRLNLQNATDKKYFEAASGGRATPVAGRTAIVTTTYRF